MQAKRINFIDILCPPSLRLSSKPPKVICMLEPGAKGFECRSYSGAVTAEHLFTTSSPMIPGEKKKKKKKHTCIHILLQFLLSMLLMDRNSVVFPSSDFHWPFTISSLWNPSPLPSVPALRLDSGFLRIPAKPQIRSCEHGQAVLTLLMLSRNWNPRIHHTRSFLKLPKELLCLFLA